MQNYEVSDRDDDPADYAHELSTKILSSRSACYEQSLEALFVEVVTHPIRKPLRHWWAEYQHFS